MSQALSDAELDAMLADLPTETTPARKNEAAGTEAKAEPPPSPAEPPKVVQPSPRPSAGKLAITNFVDPEQLRKDVSISDAKLDEELINHSAMLAYYGGLAAKARLQRDKCKTSLEIGEAKLSETIRQRMMDDGQKVTEARLEQLVRCDPKYAMLRQLYDEANAACEQTLVALEAFKQRSSMLIQLASSSRQERGADLAMRGIDAAKESAMAAIRGRVA
ncbi:hypothetical protein [Chromobacterium phragmitis]